MRLTIVDFPEPVFPNIPNCSPEFILNVILSRAFIPVSW